jgi:MFS family permease
MINVVKNFWNLMQPIPKNIWIIGIATLFMNISSVITMTFSPLLLINVLGVTTVTVGIFEGILETLSLLTRLGFGVISDKTRNRKIFLIYGYLISIFARSCLAASSTSFMVFASRILDRISNGVQASPRDALIAEAAPQSLRSICYSLRFGLSIIGSVLGGGIGIIMSFLMGSKYNLILGFGIIPLIIATFVLTTLKRLKTPQSESNLSVSKDKQKYCLSGISHSFSLRYWRLMILTFCISFGNFSLAFLILLSQKIGIPEVLLPMIVVVKNFTCSLIVMPIGFIAEKIGKYNTLLLAFIASIISNCCFGLSNNFFGILVGVIFMGIQISINQGSFLALIAEESNNETRGTAFGIYHFINGIAVLITNLVIGSLWDFPQVAFSINNFFLFLGILTLFPLLTKSHFVHFFNQKV